MHIKKWGLWVIVLLGSLLLGSQVPVTAQGPLPTATPITGKPLPGSYQLPEHLPGYEAMPAEQVLPEQADALEYWNWYRLVFQSYRDDNWEIYGSDGFAHGQTNFTNAPAYADAQPRLSPDAAKIAFQSTAWNNTDIIVMDWGGGGRTGVALTLAQEYAPTWAPDGQRLAFVSDRDGNPEIYTANLDSSALTRLTNSPLGDTAPDWSPDGSQIAWVRYQDAVGALWVMNADGNNQRALTSNCAYMGHPRWSPDGTKIALDCDADGDGWNEIVTFTLEKNELAIVYDPGGTLVDVWVGGWSNNGTEIIFSYVKYVVYNNSLYLERTDVQVLYLSTPVGLKSLVSTGYDVLPDWVSLDSQKPYSWVRKMPEYSRTSGFWVEWTGGDRGDSGLVYESFQLQYRLGTTGTWASLWDPPFFQLGGKLGGAFLSTDTIDEIHFRSNAADGAGNLEGWPSGDGDAWTKTYLHLLKGAVKDARGYPISNALLTFSPPIWEETVKSNIPGAYEVHSKSDGNTTIQTNHAGYGNQDMRTIFVNQDLTQDVYLPPQDDVIRDGNFEGDNSINSWMLGGTLSVTLGIGYSGEHSVVLGENCSPCLSAAELIGESDYPFPAMDMDDSGNVHVIWDLWPQKLYSMRSSEGVWSTPVEIMPDHSFARGSALIVDNQDTVHAVINADIGLYYLQKPAGGNWTTETLLAIQGENPAFAADQDGTLYIAYFSSDAGEVIRKKLPGGEWQDPFVVQQGSGKLPFDLVVGPDHIVHFVYQDFYENVLYNTMLPDGTFASPQKIMGANSSTMDSPGSPRIALDSLGTIHVLGDINPTHTYISRSPGQDWSRPISVGDGIGTVDMVVSSTGTVYVVDTSSSAYLYYYYKAPSERAFEKSIISAQVGIYSYVPEIVDITTDAKGQPNIVWGGYRGLAYHAPALSLQPETSTLSQVASIPVENAPTLSFMQTIAHQESSFPTISISDTPTNTTIITPTATASWTHHWVDMAPWAGKTVTITFALHQAANQPYAHLSLDDISLGSWLTPLIADLSPRQIDSGVAATLIITGENFTTGSVVRLNATTLANIQYIDSQTLQVVLPASLPAGIYTLWVVNPQGQEGVLPQALQIGKALYLPVIIREPAP